MRVDSHVHYGSGEGYSLYCFVLSDLRSTLVYEPHELRFGTSGRRGRVADLTQLEIYINVLGELEYLQSLPRSGGGVARGEEFYFAHDLRPSSTRFDEAENGRGELCQAVVQAIRDAGMLPVNLGPIPTPALTCYSLARSRGSIMVTGSHIPFDLNGYKLNTAAGELMKADEAPIGERVLQVRARLYSQAAREAAFDATGMLQGGHRDLPPVDGSARRAYIERYLGFFAGKSLAGRRILVYQHSAVGRDLLVEVLQALGAEVTPRGRSESFVAIDTEAIDDSQLAAIQALADAALRDGPLWAVVSMDGDSDRPLILGLENGQVRFFGGDLVGMIVAEYLGADAVVVPISCNDAIDRGPLAASLEPKTRIGSPHVIAGMTAALARGRNTVCGWEANGGFLLGSDTVRRGRTLGALPTRDAVLPILGVLFSAQEQGLSLPELFAKLPPRFSRAALLRNFPRAGGQRIVQLLTAGDAVGVSRITAQLEAFFKPEAGFSAIRKIDYTDGVRILFENGEVAHFRPSGNADEFRVYAVADSQIRANAIVEAALREPGGILRSLEQELLGY
ncbi:MAG: phosphomannomutase [Acidobacteriota bacterium]